MRQPRITPKPRNPYASHLRNKPATVIPDKRNTKRNKAERKRDAERQERDE